MTFAHTALTRRGIKTVLVIILAAVAMASWAVRHIRADVEMHIAEMLSQRLSTTRESIDMWKNEQRHAAENWAQSPELVNLTGMLLRVERSPDVLAGHPLQRHLREMMAPVINQHSYTGFFLITPDSLSIGSTRDVNLGSVNLLAMHGDFLQRVFAGETAISLPQRSDVPLRDAFGVLRDGVSTMFVGAPVRNAAGEIVAALTFRIRPEGEFSHYAKLGRSGRSLEVVLFDAQARLLTESRFEDVLQRSGLLKKGWSSVLNFSLRNPGVNLSTLNQSAGEKLPADYASRPLTYMAAYAVVGESGMDLSGHADYRGVPVVSAWLWNVQEGYGMAAKMDVSDAYGLFNNMRFTLVGVMVTMIVVVMLMVFILEGVNRRSAQELNVSEARYRQLFDVIPDAIIVHRQGKISYYNAAAVDMFGVFSDADFTGKPAIELVHPDDRSWVEARIRQAMSADGILPLCEERLLRMDGESFVAEVEGCRFREEGEDAVLVVARDISLRKQAEEESERLRVAVEQSPEAVVITDSTGKIVYANQATLRMTGMPLSDVAGMYAAEIRGGRQDDALSQEITTALNAGASWHGELILCRADGSERIVERRVSPVIQRGSTQYHVCVDRDVTDERRQQEKVEHSQRLESLGVLAGGIAHDFNNILTAILGNASLARMKFADNEAAVKFLDRIERSSNRAAELCKQMLAYSGKGHFIIKPVNLSLMLRETANLLQVSIGKGIQLDFDLNANIPTVQVDTTQLQQVMMNLVINASDAIGKAAGVITLRTGVLQVDAYELEKSSTGEDLVPGPYVFLEVRDSGCGMSEETKKKLFDPFYTTKFTGRGLGMSAVLGIVRGHHGAIIVKSKPGAGTVFRILLPPSDSIASDDIEVDDDVAEWCPAGTVLVVDDEIDVREAAVMMLEDMGFQTIQAGDGEEAVAVYRRYRQDIALVLLDMTMPKLDGLGCFLKLRELDPHVRVLLSSGYNEKEVTSAFAEDELDGFVQKPYRIEVLSTQIRQVFEK
ncbi:MAG: PAS domain S-box protein [Mariprofundaceae bacterium]|nr:PAS domain S-box protein [Mariprofundaceae bacterium]